MEETSHSSAIGIDFGTSKITLSAWFNGHSEIILNEEGERYTPSCVHFTEEERLIGTLADSLMGKCPWNYVLNFKKLFSSQESDPAVQKCLQTSSYKVESDANGRTCILVDCRGQRRLYPEQVAAMLFAKLKACAEKQLKHEVKYAVLSVPYAFSLSQIEALKDAALIAGLYILSTVTEGALAGAEFAWRNIEKNGPGFILFFNMGGGYVDVSLCNIQCGSCFVVCTGGCEVGSVDMDNALISHCMREFTKSTGKSLDKNYKALRKLRSGCEKAKKVLSSLTETVIDIPCLVGDEDFTLPITRDKFEEINKEVFEECRKTLERVLNSTKVTKDLIKEVVLLGGGTRIPKIKQIIQAFFNKEPKCNLNADEAVANGAAIHAAMLSNELYYHNISLDGKIFFNDVLTSDIGIDLHSGFVPVLFANMGIPGQRTVLVNAGAGNVLKVAERKNGKKCWVEDIEVSGGKDVEVGMEIDEMNVVSITLKYKDEANKMVQRGCVLSLKNKLTAEELDRMIEEEKNYSREDTRCIQAKMARNELELTCGKLKAQEVADEKVKEYASQVANHVMNWAEESGLLDSAEYVKRKRELEGVMEIIRKQDWEKLKEINDFPEEIKKLLV